MRKCIPALAIRRLHLLNFIVSGLIATSLVTGFAQDAPAHPTWPGPGQLFVGTCDQPIDRSKFTFEWFDKVIDKMQANGIRVILDIPGLPAPIWLHRQFPGLDIIAQNGTMRMIADKADRRGRWAFASSRME